MRYAPARLRVTHPLAFLGAVLAGLLAIYPWLIYPIVLRRLASRTATAIAAKRPDPAEWPALTVLIAARNEEAQIGARVQNILAQDYPRELVHIVCVSDGSTDRTDQVFREAAVHLGDRATLLRQPKAAGKPAALITGWHAVRAPIVVLTDANSHFEPGTLRALARPFADPTVGGVVGVKRILAHADRRTHEEGEGFYWRFEARLRVDEGILGACAGADGSCWAIRRELWDGSGPRGRFADDAWGAFEVIRQGFRLEFASDAVASESAALSGTAEVQRKRRTSYGLLLIVPHLGWIFGTAHRLGCFTLLSHKILRLLTPWAILGHMLLLLRAGRLWSLVAIAEAGVVGWLILLSTARMQVTGWLRFPARAGYFFIAQAGPALAGVDALKALATGDVGEVAHHPTTRSASRTNRTADPLACSPRTKISPSSSI